jgi:phenylacetate-CoA ligase
MAATVHGARLRMRRAGPMTGRLRERALERESWSPEQWREWRRERLAFVLERAMTRVPYYRDHWSNRRRSGDRASWELLENWPILEKDVVRADPKQFVADDRPLWRLAEERTSGTTGKPVTVYRSRRMDQELYALSAVRSRGWHGLGPGDRWAMVSGELVTPVSARRPPFWVWNAAQNQLYMSSYHLSPDFLPLYCDALVRYRIRYVFGYTSSLVALAREAARTGRTDLGLRVAITNAETLLAEQRAIIEDGLGCPVRETYGMTEAVAFASECEHGVLHEWPEVGIVERLTEDGPDASGGGAELICTGLLNLDMLLIRYRVGDWGHSVENLPCACGRTLPRFYRIEGRSDDVLMTQDGRRVGRLHRVFQAKDLPVREGQIVQETLNRIRVRVVPDANYTDDASRLITRQLRERMGEVEVIVDLVDDIPRTSAGKFRAVVSELEKETT